MSPVPPLAKPLAQRSPALPEGQGDSRLGTHAESVGCEAGTPGAGLAPAGRAVPDGIAVYQVARAEKSAFWINELIAPVLVAIRAVGRPIELRPMKFAGFSAGACKLRNPDGRIQLSSKASFWSKTQFVSVYTHELSHCLLEQAEPGVSHGHDACFYALNLTLFLRLDAINYLASETYSDWATDMTIYDMQDPPECWQDAPVHVWKPRAIGWAMRVANEVFSSDSTAEKLAVLIAKKYAAWVQEMAEEPKKIARAKAVAAEKARSAAEKLQLFQWLACLFFFVNVLILAVVYFSPR